MTHDELKRERQRLAGALKQLRLSNGVSSTKLGVALGWSQSKVSKIENGVTAAAAEDVERWVNHFDPGSEASAELVEQARRLEIQAFAWREVHRQGPGADQRRRASRTAQVTATAVYQSELVPGLLQTPEYARSVLEEHSQVPAEAIAETVRARLDSQAALFDPSRSFEFLITERALRWRPGSIPTALAQLDRIRTLATLPSITIGLIERAADAAAKPLHSFVLLRYADHAEVEIETLTAEITVTAEQDVAAYEQFLDDARKHATTGAALAAVLDALSAELRADDQ
ncbi:MAG: helix-turn-helix domain-containing protein [Dehalococcoidia bacterium]